MVDFDVFSESFAILYFEAAILGSQFYRFLTQQCSHNAWQWRWLPIRRLKSNFLQIYFFKIYLVLFLTFAFGDGSSLYD